MTELLEARNVSKVFGAGLVHKAQTIALQDFSFKIDGETPSVTAIVGESGSGKTTLVRLLLGLTTPTTGEVLYRGKDLRHLTAQERRSYLGDVQAIFQDPFEVFNPFYKVDHVLESPIRNFGLAKSRQARRALMVEALSAVGLQAGETLGRYPHQLSGGQRQRITVARALVLKPRLIVADEPVSMVDASSRVEILDLLQGLQQQRGVSFLYITHDIASARHFADRIAVMHLGSIVETGSARQVIDQPVHPYTRALIAAVPEPDPANRFRRRATEKWQDTPGLAIHPECPHGGSIDAPAVLLEVSGDPGHSVACHLEPARGR
jgi:ABC-type oligopeptide transport system ATPase subunit